MFIGSYEIKNPYILAPMAGVSQMPFRRMALKMGAGLAPTELVSAKGLFYESARTKAYLTHDKKIEKPFCVQLFGGDAASMAEASRKAYEMGAHIIDINMGCPVKKVTKINAGSALLCDLKRASEIVSAMYQATDYKIPITAKIRSGWDQDNLNYLEVGRVLEDSGIKALALHARTRAQGYSGLADWSHIAKLKAYLKIPIIGNGDILSISDAKKMFLETNCDAVMIGRASLGNPWIFRDLQAGFEGEVSSYERLEVILEHLADHIELCYQMATIEGRSLALEQAVKSFRSHLIWYSKGIVSGAKFRQNIMLSTCLDKTKDLIIEFFKDAKKANNFEPDEDGIDYRQAFG
jgi:tRNA-dihydrouridine synthase B